MDWIYQQLRRRFDRSCIWLGSLSWRFSNILDFNRHYF
jgi:hypothetical protein